MGAALEKKLEQLAEEQAGAVSVAQAIALGIPRRDFELLGYERLARGVYRFPGSAESWERRMWTAILQTGGVASHRSAAWLWRLSGVHEPPDRIEVIVPHWNKRGVDRAKVHRSRSFILEHETKVRGIPVTTLARTLVDLSEVMTAGALEAAYNSALKKEPELHVALDDQFGAMPKRGHEGVANLFALVRRGEPAVDSTLEVRLRRLLRRWRLPVPQTQHPVYDGTQLVMRADFAWPENDPPVAVLTHGEEFHRVSKRWRTDQRQMASLSSMGWREIPCTWEDVTKNPEELRIKIERALAGYVSDGKFRPK
ncbi:MAG: hypothetical protein QM723_07420 [Myxococcaceae bacterium]